MLRAAPATTAIATSAFRNCGDRNASAALASANTAPKEGRYNVRSAIRNSLGMTTLATGEIVTTIHASPIAMPGIERRVRHATTASAAQTSSPATRHLVTAVEAASSPGESPAE